MYGREWGVFGGVDGLVWVVGEYLARKGGVGISQGCHLVSLGGSCMSKHITLQQRTKNQSPFGVLYLDRKTPESRISATTSTIQTAPSFQPVLFQHAPKVSCDQSCNIHSNQPF